jgi:hypothetical protein
MGRRAGIWHIWGFLGALYASMSIAARVLELAWTTGVIYVPSRMFVARARIEIVTYSRKNPYPPPAAVKLKRCPNSILKSAVWPMAEEPCGVYALSARTAA